MAGMEYYHGRYEVSDVLYRLWLLVTYVGFVVGVVAVVWGNTARSY
jgi:hypothetical protein